MRERGVSRYSLLIALLFNSFSLRVSVLVFERRVYGSQNKELAHASGISPIKTGARAVS